MQTILFKVKLQLEFIEVNMYDLFQVAGLRTKIIFKFINTSLCYLFSSTLSDMLHYLIEFSCKKIR